MSLTVFCSQAFLGRGTFGVLWRNHTEHYVKSPCCFHAGSDSAELGWLSLVMSNMSGCHPELWLLSLTPVLCTLEGSQALRRVRSGPSVSPGRGLSTPLQRCLNILRPMADLDLVLAKLACFCASRSPVGPGSC